MRDLLRTKLHRPRLGRNHSPRPALVARLNEAVGGDVTLVSAPVGYGKSTFVAEWAAGAGLPVAWLALDDSDNEVRIFLSYLIGAIRGVWPDACSTSWALAWADADLSADTFVPILINEIDDLPERFALVLDDYHLITLPAIHDLMDQILRRPPLQMHLVIISRVDPPLALLRLKASGQLAEFRVNDLRFSDAAATAYLHLALPTGDDQVLAAIRNRSEGWIAGMVMASLSMAGVDSSGALAALASWDDQAILDYLFDQVLRHQPPVVRDFLARLAILNRISMPLAQAVAGLAEPSAMPSLASLEQAGLLIRSMDPAGEWVVSHSLLRDLLLRLLEQTHTPDQIAELHRRAAIWFASEGDIDTALSYAQTAGDVALATRIVRDEIIARIGTERMNATLPWIDSLPIETVNQDPLLLIGKANALNNRLQWDALLPLIRQAEDQLLRRERQLPADEVALLRTYLNWMWVLHWTRVSQPQLMKDAIERALATLPAGHPQASSLALFSYPIALQWLGEFDAAERWLNAALADASNHPRGRFQTMQVLFGLTLLQVAEGYLDRGRQLGQLLLEISQELRVDTMTAWAHLALGAAAFQANDLETAVRHFEPCVALRYVGNVIAGQESLAGLALCYQLLGRRDEARGVMAIMADYHRELVNPQLLAAYRALQARLALIEGDLVSARRWGGDPEAETGIALGWFVIPAITHIRILIEGTDPGQLAGCRPRLDRLLEEMTRVRQPTRQVELLALRAALESKLGEPDLALGSLQQALALSEPRGLIRPIVSAGPPVEGLLDVIAQRQPSSHIQAIQRAFRADASSRRTESEPPRLTPREREVLSLLAQYQTDRAIAEALVVSPLTVRTHVDNLAEKLGVRGRRAVVTRARELGLLA